LIVVPDLNLGVFVFTNSEYINAVDLSYQILDLWIPETKEKEQKQKVYKHNTGELEKFTGQFRELNSDMGMKMFVENDTLKALSSFGRQPVPLRSATDNSFTRFDNYSVVHSFPTEDSEVDMMVDFGGAIFYFERIELAREPNRNLEEFAGEYFSAELDVSYEIEATADHLNLSYPNNPEIPLREGERDIFGSNRRTKYSFQRDKAGNITSFTVASEGTVKGILFEKNN
jgi:hypothetical protein